MARKYILKESEPDLTIEVVILCTRFKLVPGWRDNLTTYEF